MVGIPIPVATHLCTPVGRSSRWHLLPRSIALVSILLFGGPAFSQTSQLLDLNPGSASTASSTPKNFISFGTHVYFQANETETGAELWRTDGTAVGTERSTDLYRGADSGTFTPLGVANGRLLFNGGDGSEWQSLWATDGLAPAARLLPVTGIYGGYCQSALVHANTLYCVYWGGPYGTFVLRSDGTPGGTQFITPPGRSAYSRLGQLGGDLYYIANPAGGNAKLYRNSGSLAGESEVMDFGSASINSSSEFLAVGGTLFFSVRTTGTGRELWKSDGTAPGTVLVKDIRPGTLSSSPGGFVALGTALLFNASDGTTGTELWRSDGTEAGTQLVKDIQPGLNSAVDNTATRRRVVGSTLYFAADDGVHGRELWKSDGTGANTTLVADVFAGSGASDPDGLVELNGTLYFRAASDTGGSELWKSNGSPGGTSQVIDLFPGLGSGMSTASLPGASADAIYFAGDDGTGSGYELWKSDGTAGGTELVADISAGPANGLSSPYPSSEPGASIDQAEWGDRIFFAGDDGTHGLELWVTNGTSAGTSLFLDISPGAASSSPRQFQKAGNRLYFFADDGTHGVELWKSDGTVGGTAMVADLGIVPPPPPSAGVFNRGRTTLALNGKLLFVESTKLWASDGTAAGTVVLHSDIATYFGGPGTLSGYAYFVASDYTLWRTDGTVAGTVQFFTNTACCAEGPMLRVGSRLLWEGANSALAWGAIWATDGTTAGTQRVLEWSADTEWRQSAGTYLFFVGDDGVHGNELWKSDGTPGGASIVKDILPGSASSAPHFVTAVGNLVFFAADDGSHGAELWKSDGSEANTAMVKDIVAGLGSSSPACLREVNGYLYFAAGDAATGMELWRSDGTEVGTVPLGEIASGAISSSPCEFLEVGGHLVFSAFDPTDGRELWVAPDISGRILLDGFESGDTNAWSSATLP